MIGGGIAGCSSALTLADAGYEVILLEALEELLLGSSNSTPCRIGLGFHYKHIPTAISCLHAAIQFIRKYPEYLLGCQKDDSYLNYNRYILIDNNDKDEICASYEAIKQEYQRLVEADSNNRVLGEPAQIFKLKPIAALNDPLINTKFMLDKPIPGEYCANFYFETVEKTLDWKRFRKDLIKKILSHSRIKVYTQAKVIKLTRQTNLDATRFIVTARKNDGTHLSFECNSIVNAAWQNIENLHAQLGYHYIHKNRTNRLKAMAKIELQPALRKMPSTIFCFGPYCSFTNAGIDLETGKYIAYLTYEPVTNIADGQSEAISVTETAERFLSGNRSQAEIIGVAKAIIQGVARFIPAIHDAETIQTYFGNVRTKGMVDIMSVNSDFHKRDYSGAEMTEIVGAPIAASAKLLYGMRVAAEIKSFVENELLVIEVVRSFIIDKPELINHRASLELILRDILLPQHLYFKVPLHDMLKIIWQAKIQLHTALHSANFQQNPKQKFKLFSKPPNPALKKSVPLLDFSGSRVSQ
jgi:glycine/D-amino acid oxidase-like deaminating enzyme